MKQASFYRNACVIASSLAVALCMFPVMSVAQEASLEEVIVTARKQEESLQDAPVTVSAFTEAAIENRAAQSLDDIARFIPGLSFSKAFGRDTERPVIRGLGSILAGVEIGAEAGAAYFIDGIYYPGDLQGLNLQDLERVEVIKGPQSALYGRNTYSGAINFVTRAPAEELEARIKVRVAEHDESDVTFYIGGPINDTLSGGLSLRHYEKDGEWTNQVTQQEVGDESTWSFSGVLDWNPTDNFHVRLRRIQRRDEDGTVPYFLQPATSNNCFPGLRSLAFWSVSPSTNDNQYFCGEIRPGRVALNDGPDADGEPNLVPGIPADPLTRPQFGPFPPNPLTVDPYNLGTGIPFSGLDRRVNFNSLLSEYTFPSDYRLILGVSYREEETLSGSDSDFSGINFIVRPGESSNFANVGRGIARDYSVELRLESPLANALRWAAGLFYYDGRETDYDISFQNRFGVFASTFETENEAVFASVAYDFTEQLTGSVEVRVAEETRTVQDGSFDETDSWHSVTPRVTLDYRLNDSILLYGVYSQGVKPGGFNADGVPSGNPTFDQEESDNYELGIKSQWWDNRLQTNLALFFIDADDIQLTTPIPPIGGGALTSIVTNQGSGEVFGVELDVQLLLTPDLTIGFNYALADSEFTEGCDEFQWTLTSGGGRYNAADPSASTDPAGDGLVGDCSIEGNQFPLSSEHQASFFADYERTISGDMSVFAGVDVSYEDKKYVQVHNLASVPDATLVGARIGFRWKQAELAIVGTNLTDEDAPILATRWLQIPLAFFTVTGNTAGRAFDRAWPRAFFAPLREGRQIGVEFKYNF